MNKMKTRLLGLMSRNEIPMLWGAPGVGKTSFLKALAEEQEWECLIVPLAGKQPEEIQGYSVRKGANAIEPLLPYWAEIAIQNKGESLIFFDEFGSAFPETQGAALSILQERRIGREVFPERVHFVAAGNPPHQAAGGYLMSAPLANRLIHIDFQPNPKEWAQGMATNWNQGFDNINDVRGYGLVATYVERFPNNLISVPEDETKASKGWPSPRTWEKVAVELSLASENNYQLDVTDLSGSIGESYALEFLHWYRMNDIPSPLEVIEMGNKFQFPTQVSEQDRFLAIITSVSSLIETDLEKYWEDGWKVINNGLNIRGDLVWSKAQHLAIIGREVGLEVPQEVIPTLRKLIEASKIM